jgi:ribosomal protein RSM22 (predicted rRNA methylase)
VIAYLHRKFPENFSIACRILTEIRFRCPEFKPKTFLDFGAGLSPGGHAFFDIYIEGDKSIEKLRKAKRRSKKVETDYLEGSEKENRIVCVEPNQYMSRLGQFISKELTSMKWVETLFESFPLVGSHGFDIVYCSFVLEELPTPEKRMEVITALFERTNKGGYCVFVLPGSPSGFRFLNDLREVFRVMPREEATIIGPCPHHFACPMAKTSSNWCRFEQSWMSYPKKVYPRKSKSRHVIRSKFCYLIVKKGDLGFEISKDPEVLFEVDKEEEVQMDEMETIFNKIKKKELQKQDQGVDGPGNEFQIKEIRNKEINYDMKEGEMKLKQQNKEFWSLDSFEDNDDFTFSEEIEEQKETEKEEIPQENTKDEKLELDNTINNLMETLENNEDIVDENEEEIFPHTTTKNPKKFKNLSSNQEKDLKRVYHRSFFWQRIIRPSQRKGKHSIVYLCNINGDLESRVIAKSHGLEGGYRFSKKAKWGDLWPYSLRIPNKFRKEKLGSKRLW